MTLSGLAVETAAPRWIVAPADPLFRDDYDRRGFAFAHRLDNHPLLDIAHLVEVAEEITARGLQKHLFAFDSRPATPSAKFGGLSHKLEPREALARIDEAGVWLKLTELNEALPEYRALAHEILSDIDLLTGLNIRGEVSYLYFTIIIASPRIVTPFHIDHESNFLFQIKGEKDIFLFDPEDRRVLTEREIESFYRGNEDAAEYREHLAATGERFRLTPGIAIHNPPLGPHWVKNDDNVSVSLSLNFSRPNLEFSARVRQANLLLRHFGLSPKPPGVSPGADRVKSAAIRAISAKSMGNRDQILFSGVNRVLSPLRALKRLSPGKR